MADTGHSHRPLSPHLEIYRWELGMTLSILHRATGVGLGITGLLLVWWFLAAAVGPEYFDFVNGLMTSWVGIFILTVSLWGFWLHFFNGIRHLRWDYGKGLGNRTAARTAWWTLILSFVFTAANLYLAG